MSQSDVDISLDELNKRLETFKEQLQSVQQLLQTDPTNSEFLGIAKDLNEVIQLTTEMIRLKTSNSNFSKQTIESHDTNGKQRDVTEGDISSEPVYNIGEIYEVQANNQENQTSTPNIWYPAIIEKYSPASKLYKVRYLGFNTEQEIPATCIQQIQSDVSLTNSNLVFPLPDKIQIGFECEAKYYLDGQYYVCNIIERTSNGYKVLFKGYGNTEEVPYKYLRPIQSIQLKLQDVDLQSQSQQVNQHSEEDSVTPLSANNEGIRGKPPINNLKAAPVVRTVKIPDHLQILPTDTIEEKERKRKRIRHIKNINRQKNIEHERDVKQHGWQLFQHKSMRKKQKTLLSGAVGKRGGSIFASPSTVDGKVGVVGSGKGMTEFQDTRVSKGKRIP